ncbi:MAG TPA: hypothetical protein VFL83_23450 [Anaeromyxobacter sp.]|nr:hypothetical protein [Anaeromyxobacter sp.]
MARPATLAAMPLLPVATLAVSLAAAAPGSSSPTERQARALVSDFVTSDLQGRAERYELSELSPERMKEVQPPEGSEEIPDTGLLFDSVREPFVAVTSHRVLDVQVRGATGFATVEYAKVAESGRLLELRESAGIERLVLRLRHDGRRWWVVDPPPAHVDLGVLVRMFEAELKPYDAAWEAQATPQQKASRDRTAAGLRVLRDAAARAGSPGR